jgi:hypothetical protein
MLTSPSHPARTTPRLSRIWTTLTLIAAVLMMLACMQVTTLKTAPASILRLEVLLDGGLAPTSQVKVAVTIITTSSAWVKFAGHQKLTCNGVTIPEVDSPQANEPPVQRWFHVNRPVWCTGLCTPMRMDTRPRLSFQRRRRILYNLSHKSLGPVSGSTEYRDSDAS